MSIKLEDYFDRDTFGRIKACADQHETPFLVVDLKTIDRAYDELVDGFPFAKVYYAVKANPANEVLSLLRDKGSNFDIASIYELEKVLALGVKPEQISFGNTIKKARHIRAFYEKGVRLYATDSEADLRNIAKAAPGSKIYVRILTEGSTTADWPLSRKFGCQTDMAMDLLVLAKELGLEPYGISFHVGSQQANLGAWDAALSMAAGVFREMATRGIELKMVNMGGGFPTRYLKDVPAAQAYGQAIFGALRRDDSGLGVLRDGGGHQGPHSALAAAAAKAAAALNAGGAASVGGSRNPYASHLIDKESDGKKGSGGDDGKGGKAQSPEKDSGDPNFVTGVAAQLVDQGIGRGFELGVGHTLDRDAPIQRRGARNTFGAHDHVLGARDANHLLQPRRTTRTRDLAEILFRQRVATAFADDAEITGERQLEADTETVAVVNRDHRLAAALRRGHVVRQFGNVLGRRFELEVIGRCLAQLVEAPRCRYERRRNPG